MTGSPDTGRVQTWLPGRPVPSVQAALAAGGLDRLDREHLEPLIRALISEVLPPSQIAAGRGLGARGARRVLDWLEHQDGVTWRQRWDAGGGPDGSGWNAWLQSMSTTTRNVSRMAIDALIVLQAIRPTSRWMLSMSRARLWSLWTTYHDADLFDRIRNLLEAGTPAIRVRVVTLIELSRMSISSGRSLANLRAADFLAEREVLIEAGMRGAMHVAWTYARRAGLLAGEPFELGEVLRARQRTPAELVAHHGVENPAVAAMFIDYLTERQTTCDYSSLKALAGMLLKLFWGDLQRHYQGKADLALTVSEAAEWRQRIATLPNGKPRRDLGHVVSAARGLYLDIASWAHDDPARWAPWARPCPFNGRETSRMQRQNTQRQTAAMAARTRSLTMVVPQLVSSIAGTLRIAEKRLRAATGILAGEEFLLDGQAWRVAPNTHTGGYTRTQVFVLSPDGLQLDLTAEEDAAFWTWAVVEVLRHSGIRIEEMLELTHLSIRAFRKPDGQVVPLIQIAPSKTNTERVLPASPQLTHALSRIVARQLAHQQAAPVDDRGPMLPLVTRRDEYELTYSAPLPFLFQRRLGSGRRTVMSGAFVRNRLDKAAVAAGLRDTDGAPIRFTPHDFRRLFLTDAVTNGLPIHIAAQLAGHDDINTTRGYVATYPTEVFAAYDSYLARRRAQRPADEYRSPTPQELQEFAEHFGRRRVELGNCARPYGTGCSHEHACIRCDYLHVSADQAGRLDAIEQDLHQRVDRAQQQQWFGDLDQLRVTLEHLKAKKEQVALSPSSDGSPIDLLLTAPPMTIPTGQPPAALQPTAPA